MILMRVYLFKHLLLLADLKMTEPETRHGDSVKMAKSIGIRQQS